MNVEVLTTRQSGVALPKQDVLARPRTCGTLTTYEIFDKALGRSVMVAQLTLPTSSTALALPLLHDVRLLHISNQALVLSGFERNSRERGGPIETAQSWLCYFTVGGSVSTPGSQVEPKPVMV